MLLGCTIGVDWNGDNKYTQSLYINCEVELVRSVLYGDRTLWAGIVPVISLVQVIVISPLRVLYPDLQTPLMRTRRAPRVEVSVNGYCTIRGVITDL